MLILSCTYLNAQNLIAVEHNGVSVFYSTLDSAVNAAQTGDNVYVPGGIFTLNVSISKGFNLIGVGYNPDSTLATGFTQITSPSNFVRIITGADNGSITGIMFNNNTIIFGTGNSDQTVSNYTVSKCRMSSLQLGYGQGSATSNNLIFKENIFDGNLNGLNIQNCHFSNNMIQLSIYNFQQGNEFTDNVFLYPSTYILNAVNNSVFRNNIFLYSNGIFTNLSSNNIFYNNLFVANMSSGSLPGTDVGSLFNVAQSSIFINQVGNTYDYHQNYHLKSTCPGKNYGTDGTDLGVYGSATPWKEGGVPYNPHIQFQSIATQTDGSGNLSINIKVAAQKN